MNHSQTVAWWRERASTYFTDMVFSFSQPDLIAKLRIRPSSRVLELGFGYGRELSQFCHLSRHVYGVELSQFTCNLALQKLIEQGTTRLPTVRVYEGDRLPFKNEFFHVVYSCYLLQHMSRLSARNLLQESLRVVKPTGRVLMEFFGHPSYLHPVEDRFSGDPLNGGMYNNAYDWQGINALLFPLCEILWIEPQQVSAEGKTFNNHWACVTRGDPASA